MTIMNYVDVETAQALVDGIFRHDTDILALSPTAELVVAIFAFCCTMALHTSMIMYSVVKRRHVEHQQQHEQNTCPATVAGSMEGERAQQQQQHWFWNVVVKFWGILLHSLAAVFYCFPVLTLLSFSPLLWIFVTYLVTGVIFHHWSLILLAPTSSSNSNKPNTRFGFARNWQRRATATLQ